MLPPFSLKQGYNGDHFTDGDTEAPRGYFITLVTVDGMMLCHTSQWVELMWCFGCSLSSQSGLDHRQEVTSPELRSLLCCPPEGTALGTLVSGAVRSAGFLAWASLCAWCVPITASGGLAGAPPGPEHSDRQHRCSPGTSAGLGMWRASQGS